MEAVELAILALSENFFDHFSDKAFKQNLQSLVILQPQIDL